MLLAVLERRNTHSFFEHADEMGVAGKTQLISDFPDAFPGCGQKLLGSGHAFVTGKIHDRFSYMFFEIMGKGIFADIQKGGNIV